ncbi:MAG: Rne/Rng family ribonuclease [Candidatus Borkfalkiaceae bacterium]|nr:Rne/Rng family ribonuclease [Christensenellaceae bacterium]
MSESIYVDSFGGNIIGALADGTKLIEYRLEKMNKTVTIGSVFRGRVENVLGGMQAAFVYVGLARNGYLSAGDMLMDRSELEGKVEIPSILDLKEGDEIMVQAVKDPAGSKGVRLTRNVSFAGRNVVYMPGIPFVGVSRRITDEKQREKLTKIAEDVKPKKGGIIIRTAGEYASKAEIRKELSFLVKQYAIIEERFRNARAGECVYEEGNLAFRIIRDVYHPSVEKFVIGDKTLYEKVFDYARQADDGLKSKLRLYHGKVDMFTYYGLSADVDSLMKNRVDLESGAYLVIDKTEALTVIDVNTGSFVGQDNLEDTVYFTNVLAAKEIARQLRLRNLSGIIVVDFIDMAEESHRAKVLEVLSEAVAKDREKCTVVGMSGLGLVEITRKKRRRESASSLVKTCPYCQGSGLVQSNDYIVMRIRTGLLDLFADGYDNAVVDLNVEICDYILAHRCLKKDVERIWQDKRVYLIPHKTYHQQFFLIKGDNNKAMEVPDKAVLLY